jgi:hypothetical protein
LLVELVPTLRVGMPSSTPRVVRDPAPATRNRATHKDVSE